jgi:serine/threonine protein kinase
MIGQILSHYKILEKIGEGGMGEVYKAEDTKLKRTIALKFLPKTMTANAESRARFEQEAQVAAALNHPNIVTVYEIGEHDEQVFMAMEYVDGQTLKEKIAFHPLPLTEVLEITEKICEGLGAAHKAGIIHRDIKPQNILVDKNNHIKILDFGLAKLKGVSPLTKEASTLGTVNYMSPEQAKGKEVDQRTDIWSLGVVLYEMLTGELPFKGDYEQAVIYSILNEQPEKATEIHRMN